MASQTDWIVVCLKGGRLSQDEVARLEADLVEQPDNLRARIELLGHYFLKQATGGRSRYEQHALWTIAHHPELDLGAFNTIDESQSPSAYAEALRLWQAAIAQQPENATILWNASSFVMQEPLHAEELLRRGAIMEPGAARWHGALARLHTLAAQHDGSDERRAALGREALGEYERALALEPSPDGRYGFLIDLAEAAFAVKDYARAAEYAERVLTESGDFEGMWIHGNGIHVGHIVLGRVALVRDDVASACEHLAAAGATPGSPQLSSFGPDQDLAVELLARGERDAVIAYAEACKRFYNRGLGRLGGCVPEASMTERSDVELHARSMLLP